MTDTAQPNAEPSQTDVIQDRAGGQQATPEKTFTQSELDFYISREKQEIQRKFSDYDALAEKAAAFDELKQAEMSELEKMQQQLAAKDAEIAAANLKAETERLNALRLRVGQEAGLPPVLAARLQGADEDALKADAEAVKAVLGSNETYVPNIDATAGGGQTSKPPTVNLSPSQRKAADFAIRRGVFKDYQEYAESLRDMQGE